MNKKHSYVCSFVSFSCILRIGNSNLESCGADRSIDFLCNDNSLVAEQGNIESDPDDGTVIALWIYRKQCFSSLGTRIRKMLGDI
jgi:hypothetical protein